MADGTCSIDGCSKPVNARSWCNTHYYRWRKTGDPSAPLDRERNIGTCSVEGCDEPMRKRGWCAAHYSQQYRSGKPPRPFIYKWANETCCLVCGSPDMNYRSRKYCSANCQMLASRARRGYPDATRPSRPCARCARPIDLLAAGVTHSSRRKRSSRKRRADTRLCADCKRQNGYRHHWSVQALAARDGAACKLCRQPVDMGLRSPDPMSPSVDHLISRADGGTDDPANLQLAHLTCNHQKSRRSGWTVP